MLPLAGVATRTRAGLGDPFLATVFHKSPGYEHGAKAHTLFFFRYWIYADWSGTASGNSLAATATTSARPLPFASLQPDMCCSMQLGLQIGSTDSGRRRRCRPSLNILRCSGFDAGLGQKDPHPGRTFLCGGFLRWRPLHYD